MKSCGVGKFVQVPSSTLKESLVSLVFCCDKEV